MIKRSLPLVLTILLSACAVQEEMIAEEPMVMEDDIAGVSPVDKCGAEDDDGIGGTGCEPVARRLSEP